jgi:hypothetical protein
MPTTNETLALEKAPKDEFLALIEKVVLNPDVDAEKLKVIVGLKLQLEDRAAEKAFDAAMQEAQKEVQALRWDKVSTEASKARWVSYPTIDAMLKPIREKYGFSESFGVEPELPAPNLMMMYSDVTHKTEAGSHRRRFHLPMSISGEGPKGGGVMTAAQAVGNGSSYGMRYLEKLIWKIPMLVDKDDNDGNQIRATISDAEKSNLEKMLKPFDDFRKKKFLEKFKIDSLADLPKSQYNKAIDVINQVVTTEAKKGAMVNADQAATLTALIEEVGGDCKERFLKANQIKKVGELPAGQYQACLKELQEQRRG